jgi:hypothetical protein
MLRSGRAIETGIVARHSRRKQFTLRNLADQVLPMTRDRRDIQAPHPPRRGD